MSIQQWLLQVNNPVRLDFFHLSLILPFWVMAFILLPMIALIPVLIWRRHKPVRAIDRLSSLAWQASGIATFASSLPQLKLEFASARRYQRPLSVAVFRLETNQNTPIHMEAARKNGNGSAKGTLAVADAIQLVFPLIGSILQAAVRRSDKVTYDGANNQYVVMFTQTDKSGSVHSLRRIKEMLANKSYISLKTGLAQYPADGLTLENLVSAARLASELPHIDGEFVPPVATSEMPSIVSN